MLKILVTGAKGQLGSEIRDLSIVYPDWYFLFVDVEELDLSSDEAIERFFALNSADIVVNCAAYTAVDRAEQDKAIAYRVNADAVKTIASQCKQRNIRLIHISTDYVFDGTGNLPLTENAPTNPLSIYGKSKLEGERHVLDELSNAYVIRTAWVYSTHGKNFVKTISKLASEREFLSVVADQIGSPTYARDLASTILQIIKKISRQEVDVPGVYHFSNEGVTSWYDLAWFIVQHYGLPCRVNPIASEAYPTLAVRPKFTVLDKSKLKSVFGIEVAHWHSALNECLTKLTLG